MLCIIIRAFHTLYPHSSHIFNGNNPNLRRGLHINRARHYLYSLPRRDQLTGEREERNEGYLSNQRDETSRPYVPTYTTSAQVLPWPKLHSVPLTLRITYLYLTSEKSKCWRHRADVIVQTKRDISFLYSTMTWNDVWTMTAERRRSHDTIVL